MDDTDIIKHTQEQIRAIMFNVPEWNKSDYKVLRVKEHRSKWLKLIRLDRFVTWKTIQLPAAHREEVVIDLLVPREDRLRKPTKIVICLQILGGADVVSKIFAYYFALKGYPALIVHRSKNLFTLNLQNEHLEDTLGEFNENIRNVAIIHRQAIDFALWYLYEESELPQVDKESVYAVGVSLGGITLSGLAAVEDKIEKSVIVMAGGDVGEVLTTSGESRVKRNVDAITKRYGISRDDLKAELRKHVIYGNSKVIYAIGASEGFIPSWKYRMFVSLFDRDVPTKTQHTLRKLLNCKAIYMPTGHYTSAIFLPFILWYSRKFFERA